MDPRKLAAFCKAAGLKPGVVPTALKRVQQHDPTSTQHETPPAKRRAEGGEDPTSCGAMPPRLLAERLAMSKTEPTQQETPPGGGDALGAELIEDAALVSAVCEAG
jgi:hypothetical protein